MLVGNLVAIGFSALVTITMSLISPDNYDWQTTREIPMIDDSETGTCPPPDYVCLVDSAVADFTQNFPLLYVP